MDSHNDSLRYLASVRWAALSRQIGARYGDCTFENFDAETSEQKRAVAACKEFASDISENIRIGRGLFLHGSCGCGKDHLLVCAMRAAVEAGHFVCWTGGLRLFAAVRDLISERQSEASFIDRFAEADVLAVSDLYSGRESLTAHQVDVLMQIVDRRYRDCQPIWVTVNCHSRKDAEDRLTPALVDRLADGCLGIYTNWPSYRKAAK